MTEVVFYQGNAEPLPPMAGGSPPAYIGVGWDVQPIRLPTSKRTRLYQEDIFGIPAPYIGEGFDAPAARPPLPKRIRLYQEDVFGPPAPYVGVGWDADNARIKNRRKISVTYEEDILKVAPSVITSVDLGWDTLEKLHLRSKGKLVISTVTGGGALISSQLFVGWDIDENRYFKPDRFFRAEVEYPFAEVFPPVQIGWDVEDIKQPRRESLFRFEDEFVPAGPQPVVNWWDDRQRFQVRRKGKLVISVVTGGGTVAITSVQLFVGWDLEDSRPGKRHGRFRFEDALIVPSVVIAAPFPEGWQVSDLQVAAKKEMRVEDEPRFTAPIVVPPVVRVGWDVDERVRKRKKILRFEEVFFHRAVVVVTPAPVGWEIEQVFPERKKVSIFEEAFFYRIVALAAPTPVGWEIDKPVVRKQPVAPREEESLFVSVAYGVVFGWDIEDAVRLREVTRVEEEPELYEQLVQAPMVVDEEKPFKHKRLSHVAEELDLFERAISLEAFGAFEEDILPRKKKTHWDFFSQEVVVFFPPPEFPPGEILVDAVLGVSETSMLLVSIPSLKGLSELSVQIVSIDSVEGVSVISTLEVD